MVLATLMLVACSSSNNSGGNPARNYLGTQNPGDVWSWVITTGSGGTGAFSAENVTLVNTYSGDVLLLALRLPE